jgi:hypothetical protein
MVDYVASSLRNRDGIPSNTGLLYFENNIKCNGINKTGK